MPPIEEKMSGAPLPNARKVTPCGSERHIDTYNYMLFKTEQKKVGSIEDERSTNNGNKHNHRNMIRQAEGLGDGQQGRTKTGDGGGKMKRIKRGKERERGDI